MKTRRRIRGVSPPSSAAASSPKNIPPSLKGRSKPYREGRGDERIREAAGGEGGGLGAEDEARKDGRGREGHIPRRDLPDGSEGPRSRDSQEAAPRPQERSGGCRSRAEADRRGGADEVRGCRRGWERGRVVRGRQGEGPPDEGGDRQGNLQRPSQHHPDQDRLRE